MKVNPLIDDYKTALLVLTVIIFVKLGLKILFNAKRKAKIPQ